MALTIAVGVISGASVTVSGARSDSAPVAVAVPEAVVGVINYPDAVSWSCIVSSLPPGATTVTASSGAEQVSVTVTMLSIAAGSVSNGSVRVFGTRASGTAVTVTRNR